MSLLKKLLIPSHHFAPTAQKTFNILTTFFNCITTNLAPLTQSTPAAARGDSRHLARSTTGSSNVGGRDNLPRR